MGFTMAKHKEVQCRHFRWRIFQRPGSDVWYADGRGNKPYNLKRCSLDETDQDAALEALRQLDRHMAIKFGLIIKLDAGDDQKLLLIPAGVDMYLEWIGRPTVAGGASAGTIKRYKAVLDKFKAFVDKKGIKYWQHVNDKILTGYCAWLEQREYAYATQYHEITTLKQATKAMANKLGVSSLPKLNINLRKPRGTTTYCYSTTEVDAMVRHCMAKPYLVWLGRVITALAHTGLRISELTQLRWTDIKDGEIHLPDQSLYGTKAQRERARSTKGKRSRHLPIHNSLAKMLEEMEHQPAGRIFDCPRGGQLQPDRVRRALVRELIEPLKNRFPKVGEDPSFEDGRVHSLRHYFVSRCADEGVPKLLIMTWVGHLDSAMVDRYYHPDQASAAGYLNQVTFMTDHTESK